MPTRQIDKRETSTIGFQWLREQLAAAEVTSQEALSRLRSEALLFSASRGGSLDTLKQEQKNFDDCAWAYGMSLVKISILSSMLERLKKFLDKGEND